MAAAEAQIAAGEQRRADRDREIKEIKQTVQGMDGKIDQLISEHNRQQGALSLGRWLISIGVPSLLGGWALALWHLFGGKN